MKNNKISKKIFSKDFLLVVIGQIISIFGNQVLRFALPLYLLNQTNSAMLFGVISACSFIPAIILCPIGGIIADRVNKRNIMVILDFSTAALALVISLLIGKMDVVILVLISLIVLYGIQGAYQPAVQSSIPMLLDNEQIIQGNAIINLVNSVAALVGPIIGGILYSYIGIVKLLYIILVCFFVSAVMELFINIPFKKAKMTGSIFKIGFEDMKDSFKYIRKDEPIIWKVSIIVCLINLFMSAAVMIGLPIVITQSLGFESDIANKLYGYAEGAIGAGSLIGGILAGIFAKRLKPKYCSRILLICTLTLIPIALSLSFTISSIIAYVIIIISCVIMMSMASLFTIQVMSYLQILTPKNMLGKVISCAMCIGMCATPLGQAIYGGLFQMCSKNTYIPFYIATILSMIIYYISKNVFIKIEILMKKIY